jgi:hypothetical protein
VDLLTEMHLLLREHGWKLKVEVETDMCGWTRRGRSKIYTWVDEHGQAVWRRWNSSKESPSIDDLRKMVRRRPE